MFNDYDRRLVMRYPTQRTFSFAKVTTDASNVALMALANAFESIQSESPVRVSTVLTRQLL